MDYRNTSYILKVNQYLYVSVVEVFTRVNEVPIKLPSPPKLITISSCVATRSYRAEIVQQNIYRVWYMCGQQHIYCIETDVRLNTQRITSLIL